MWFLDPENIEKIVLFINLTYLEFKKVNFYYFFFYPLGRKQPFGPLEENRWLFFTLYPCKKNTSYFWDKRSTLTSKVTYRYLKVIFGQFLYYCPFLVVFLNEKSFYFSYFGCKVAKFWKNHDFHSSTSWVLIVWIFIANICNTIFQIKISLSSII